MGKYLTTYKISLQETLTYRGPMAFWLLGNILSLITITSLWLAADKTGAIAGYTKNELITYYILGLSLQWFVGWYPHQWLRTEIKDGIISLSTLAKPVSLYLRAFAKELAWHSISIFIGLVASLLVALILQDHLVSLPNLAYLLPFILAVWLAALITFSLSLDLSLVAFWTSKTGPVESIFWIGLTTGGKLIPISFFPGAFLTIVNILPFRYMFSFPLEIIFGKLTPEQIIFGLSAQLVWLVMLTLTYKYALNKGVKAYAAYGN